MATTWSSLSSRSAKVVVDSGTGAAPTLATEGVSLDAVGAIQLILEADDTRTLSGAGTLQGYVYNATVAAWCRCPDLDVAVSVSAVRRQAWGAVEVLGGNGRVAWAPTGVTVSAGGTTVYMLAALDREIKGVSLTATNEAAV